MKKEAWVVAVTSCGATAYITHFAGAYGVNPDIEDATLFGSEFQAANWIMDLDEEFFDSESHVDVSPVKVTRETLVVVDRNNGKAIVVLSNNERLRLTITPAEFSALFEESTR